MNTEKVSALVNKALEENELHDCFLIEVKINGSRVEVFLDSDNQVTFAKCRMVSRYLEEVLDEKKWFGEKYTLEVSSAGVGRPLKYYRQYKKNIGRRIKIEKEDGSKIKGQLSEADENGITVTWNEKVKEGKKKINVEKNDIIPYGGIKKAKIQISF